MMVMKGCLLLQGLLLVAHCNIWPKDQGLRDREDEQLKNIPHQQQSVWDHGQFRTDHGIAGAQKGSADVPGTIRYPVEHEQVNPTDGTPSEDTEGGSADTYNNNLPERTGNWCAFVHKRVVTATVSCGSEKYIIKSQSPCPNGTPDCHLIMYKLSTRPVYREKKNILTALLWRCCPGHGGNNCEDSVDTSHVSDAEVSSTDLRLHPGGPPLRDTGSEIPTYNPNQEHNKPQETKRSIYDSLKSDEQRNYDYTPSSHNSHEPHYEKEVPHSVDNGHREPAAGSQHYANPGLVPIHYLKDVMMSHLQPIFDSFNLTLARLSEEVQDLQKDMSELQVFTMLQGESKVEGGGEKNEEPKQHEAAMENMLQVEELSLQLSLQRDEFEEKLHAQQAMLHYNLTNIKTSTDVQLKRNQKMLQTSLHSLNSSLSEVREKQEQLEENIQRVLTLASQMSSPERQPQEDTAVWEAITRLDNKVVNNTVRLSTLTENQDQVAEKMEHVQRGWRTLEEHISQNDRKIEDRYIEAFLEVDAAKVAVAKHSDELSKNFTMLQSTVQELEVDMDYLYTQFYKNLSASSRDCDCSGLSMSVAHLKRAVANISVIVNENRLALDRAAEERLNIWENGGWGQPVEELKLGLHTVQNLLAVEQEKRKTLQQALTSLQTSVLSSQTDIEALQQQDSQKSVEIKHLFNSFSSLLTDAIRHTDVLEILLGEEVLEFIDQSPQVQKVHSIPTLKMMISDLQEQINKHSQSLASMLNSEDPTAGEAFEQADWITEDLKRKQKERKLEYFSENPTAHKDLLALEKAVELLRAHMARLEAQQCLSCCDCTKAVASKDVEEKLQFELASVRKSLDHHLRVFSSIFSNTEGLTESDATVDVDQLFALMKKKEDKLHKKKQKNRADRRERDTAVQTTVRSQLLEKPLVFTASSKDGVNTSGTVIFKTTALNQRQMYSTETGRFRAPSTGVYLFVLTLDFGPGPALAQLKRGQEVAASVHQSMRQPSGPTTRVCLLQLRQGEEVHLELVRGTLQHGKPQENTFAGLLLLQTT